MSQFAVIVAHGQPSDPGPAARALARLAAEVRALLPGWRIGSATLAEPGAIADSVGPAAQGVVYPMFMAGGWFTRVQIPARLAAAGAPVGQGGWQVLEPFGCDPAVHDLCVELVRRAGATDAILAAHGSFKSTAPSDIARHVAGRIARETGARAAAGFIDQDPQLASLGGFEGICLPFFAAEGGHVTEDIPQALAAAGFRGRILPPVGLDPRVPGIIAAAILRGQTFCAEACRWTRESV
jgi:sirohydrochlorin ferrochelatase